MKSSDFVQRRVLNGLPDHMKADRTNASDESNNGREQKPLSGRPQFEAMKSGKEVVHSYVQSGILGEAAAVTASPKRQCTTPFCWGILG
jgi:hypothetical protein